METTSKNKKELMNAFAEQYIEKLFYFCLKKTGNRFDAEDLSSDISVNVINALFKGTVPDNFNAWVWQIARNRYSLWAKKKHIATLHTAFITAADNDDNLEIPKIEDIKTSVEDEYIRSEELSLLRKELAFISSDYRNIIVAYYIENRRVKDIAEALGGSEGTICSKLFRARNIIKEGMKMAKEFGIRSYKPEELSFIASGNQPSGLPWSAIRRRIPVNILCEANNNPSTVEELSIALGIAMPYMEEEAGLLENAELLKRTPDGKLVTNFFITPSECHQEILDLSYAFAKAHYAEIWELAKYAVKETEKFDIDTTAYSENDTLMYFALHLEQLLAYNVLPNSIYTKFKRKDGGSWGFIGYERGEQHCEISSIFFSSNGCGIDIMWDGFQRHRSSSLTNRYEKDTPDYSNLVTLKAVADGKIATSPIPEQRNALDTLINEGFCIKADDGRIFVNAIVFKNHSKAKFDNYIQSLPEFIKLREYMREYMNQTKLTVSKYCNPYVIEDIDYYTAMLSADMQGINAALWIENGLYSGNYAQFCELEY
jgi:RNA polymerase sigma factor, sigma-70 family